MPVRSITPNFVPDQNQFFFTSKELNSIAREMYADDFGFYQRLFQLYTYMPMNTRRKFIIHTPKGHPLMWQPYTSCSYEETGSITIGRRELEPEPIYMKEGFCHDVLMDSCYDHMIQYDRNGQVDLSEEARMVFQKFIDELLSNAAWGFRLSLTSGKLFDVDTVGFSDDNTANLTALFKRTHGTTRGWVKMFHDLALAEYPWLDLNLTDASDFDAAGFYNRNIVTLLDELVKNTKKPFRNLINRGGVVQEGRARFLPLIVLSDSYFQAVVDHYNIEAEKIATNRMRITRRTFGGENTPTPNSVFYLDDRLPIIPLSDINGYDAYVKGTTHFAGIIASGNIQMGTSFAAIPEDVENQDIGVAIERETRISSDNYGRYTVLSHALAKAALADANYAVGTISYTEPA